MTCPCDGFAFGESGDLNLVRLRNGREYDRLGLTQFFPRFEGPREAVLRRWARQDNDIDQALKLLPRSAKQILSPPLENRTPAKILQFADYDHDGAATEFVLQTETISCGHRNAVVVGLSRNNRRLHAFGTALHPGRTLTLEPREWDALRDSRGPVQVINTLCGDHGSDTEGELGLSTNSQGIQVISRSYECSSLGTRGRLLDQSTQ
jgi:hypothetical protein